MYLGAPEGCGKPTNLKESEIGMYSKKNQNAKEESTV